MLAHVNKLGSGNKSGSDINNKMPIQAALLPRSGYEYLIYPDDYTDMEYNFKGGLPTKSTYRFKDDARVVFYQNPNQVNPGSSTFNMFRGCANGIFIGFEVSTKTKNKDMRKGNFLTQSGITVDGKNCELRSAIVYDCPGVTLAPGAGQATIVYQLRAFNNGFIDETGKSRGHGAYVQNYTDELKDWIEYFGWNNMRRGAQTYASRGLKNITWIRPVVYNNSSINPDGFGDNNFLLGSEGEDFNLNVIDGIFYRKQGVNYRFGYNSKIFDSYDKGSFIIGGPYVISRPQRCVFSGMTIISERVKTVIDITVENNEALKSNRFSNNTYIGNGGAEFKVTDRSTGKGTVYNFEDWKKLTGDTGSVVKDYSELNTRAWVYNSEDYPGHAIITIFNPKRLKYVDIDIPGNRIGKYDLRDQQNIFGNPIATFENKNRISVRMDLTEVTLPDAVGNGQIAPKHTESDFCVFEIWKQGFKGLSVSGPDVPTNPVEPPKQEPPKVDPLTPAGKKTRIKTVSLKNQKGEVMQTIAANGIIMVNTNDYPVYLEIENDPAQIGSNKITINDKEVIENNKPYTVPEQDGDWKKYFPEPGRYGVQAIPFEGKTMSGEKGDTFYFTVLVKEAKTPGGKANAPGQLKKK